MPSFKCQNPSCPKPEENDLSKIFENSRCIDIIGMQFDGGKCPICFAGDFIYKHSLGYVICTKCEPQIQINKMDCEWCGADIILKYSVCLSPREIRKNNLRKFLILLWIVIPVIGFLLMYYFDALQ